MRNSKWLVLALAAALLLSGCSLMQVNPTRDGARTVATVNGEVITKKEVYDYLGIDWAYTVESWNRENLQTQKENALDTLISQKVLLQKAKEYGMDLMDAEDEAAIDELYQKYVGSVYDNALARYEKEAEEDESIQPEEKAQAELDAYLALIGYTQEELRTQLMQEHMGNKLKQMVYDTISVTEDEVTAEYAQLAYTQGSNFTSGDAAIDAYMQGEMIVFYPSDMYRVKQILISFDSDTITAISTQRANGDTEAADKARDEAAAAILSDAEALLSALQAGEEWDELSSEYNDDGGEDYLVCENCTAYVQEFTAAAMQLTVVGQYTKQPVLSDYGYHVIVLEEKIAAGVLEQAAVQDKVKESLLQKKQNEKWQETWSGWAEAAQVKKFVKRLA